MCVCVCTQCTAAARLPPPLVYPFEKKKEEKAADESDFES